MAKIDELRQKYHAQVCENVIFKKADGIPSMADVDNALSRKISENLLHLLPYDVGKIAIAGQTAGKRLEEITKTFLQESFDYLQHLRPGNWFFSIHDSISDFDQYRHLSELAKLVKETKSLKAALGDYVISPDIIVARHPVTDDEINQNTVIIDKTDIPKYTPIRAKNNPALILHASISCKWTLRSDRSQNART